MADRHRFWLDIDGEWTQVRVECPYRREETSRPCWPHHEEANEDGDTLMVPDPAPQEECTYTDWVDNIGWEMVQGARTVLLKGAWWDWSQGDYPVLQIGTD